MNLPPPLQQIDRTYVRVGGRKLSYFAGCDYFRLASHPKVLRAFLDGVKKYGLNVAASRMTTGNHELYGKLENALEKFFGVESATLVSSGYVTNLIVAQALAGEFSGVVLDEKAHASLLDATRFFHCPVWQFNHRDPANLARVVKRINPNAQPILFADSMFAHDGSLTPLHSYLKLLPKNSTLLIDDAHGAGTLGATGQGSPELENIPRNRVIQTMTLSKAFGVYGGAILGSRELREKILTRSRMFSGSTPLPLPLANAALQAVHIVRTEKNLRLRLKENVAYVKGRLRAGGMEISAPPSPIVAIFPKTSRAANQLKSRCLANGIFPSLIKYHGGPAGGYFRFAISSEHTRKQLNALIGTLLS